MSLAAGGTALLVRITSKGSGVATQMGNQTHAGEPIRRGVELIRAGVRCLVLVLGALVSLAERAYTLHGTPRVQHTGHELAASGAAEGAMMRFQVGVIGATGYIARDYRQEIRSIPDEARIVALCARRPQRLRAAAREDGAELATSDWREVVDHPEVNFIVVATPDALHYDAVMACAERGKHVLCEKPVGRNAGEAYRMWAACRDAGVGHYVPFWTRFIPAFARLKEVVSEGTIGEVKVVIYRWHNPRPAGMPFTWRDDPELSSAGSIADLGSHAYDLARWILGSEAKRVLTHAGVITPPRPDVGPIDLAEALDWGRAHSATAGRPARKSTTFDFADLAVEFDNSAAGSFILSHATYLRKGLAPELELHGTEASLSVDRLSGEIRLARPNEDAETFQTLPDLPRHTDPGFGNRFARHVFPAVRRQLSGEASDHPDLEDGWRAQLFTDAAALSSRRGAWVELGEVEAASQGG